MGSIRLTCYCPVISRGVGQLRSGSRRCQTRGRSNPKLCNWYSSKQQLAARLNVNLPRMEQEGAHSVVEAVWKRFAAPDGWRAFSPPSSFELVVYRAIYEIWKWHFEMKPRRAGVRPAALIA